MVHQMIAATVLRSESHWTDPAVLAAIAAAVGTIVLAGFTFVMSLATRKAAEKTGKEAAATLELAEVAKSQLEAAHEQLKRSDQQLQLAADALSTTVLPLLADVPPSSDAGVDEGVWPPPDRSNYSIRGDQLYLGTGPYHCSVPFRNVGAGVAVITEAWTEPDLHAEIDVPARIVRPGERFRVNLSVPTHAIAMSPVLKAWQGSFKVVVAYNDARGGQPLETRALIGTYATSVAAVRGISVTRAGEAEPFIISGRMEFP
jgi:hypothetical protein